jgi:lantibiotic transport system permease protein
MINALIAEALKLRRSLVLLVAATPPVMVFALGVLIVASGNGPEEWTMQTMAGSAIWAFLLLPMSVIGITALIAQLEHGPNTWSHTLALPVPRWQVFAAKVLVTLGLMAVVSFAVALAGWASVPVGLQFGDDLEMAGQFDPGLALQLYGKMFIAGLLVMAIQWTLAMRFRSFAAPVSIGIGGTFVAVAATSAEQGLYFPWLMPVNVLASEGSRGELAVMMGGLGGLIVFTLAIIWMSRRDWG